MSSKKYLELKAFPKMNEEALVHGYETHGTKVKLKNKK